MKHLQLYSTIALFLILPFASSAQDIIIQQNGQELKGYIKNIGIENITYQINEGGPFHTILRSEVYMIKFEDGTERVLSQNQTATSKQRTNAFGVNPLPLVLSPNSYAQAEFEHLFGDHISIGLRFTYFNVDDEREPDLPSPENTNEVILFQRQDLGGSLFARYYLNEGLEGLYFGVEAGASMSEIEQTWSVETEATSASDYGHITRWEGDGLTFFGGLQVGYKFVFADFFYVEPTVSGGAKLNDIDLNYDFYEWVNEDVNSNRYNEQSGMVSFDQLQYYVLPGLSLGVRF